MSAPLSGPPDPTAAAARAAVRAAEIQRLTQLRAKSVSDATWSAYLGVWERWSTWATAHERPVLPADPHDLAVWAEEAVYPPATAADDTSSNKTTSSKTTSTSSTSKQSPRGISASTLNKWMAAVTFIHRDAGHPSPLEDPTLSSVLKGLRRDMVENTTTTTARTGTGARQAPALMTEHVERIMTAIDSSPTRGESLLEVRDRALVLLAFTSAMRASELAALNVEDLEPDEAGLIVRIRSSKTDQEGAGAFLAIPWARRAHLCPVRAMDDWLDRLSQQLAVQDPTHRDSAPAGGGGPGRSSTARRSLPVRRAMVADLHGAVLRSLFHNGRVGSTMTPDPHQARMARLAITKTITARARAAGLQAADAGGRYFSAHSTRAGFATQAADNGVAERDIMNHGRWKSIAVARGYIRRGELFDDSNAAGHLGL
ncbi:tyrosine-type recombinase/integrase [Kineococcus rubinsiae]|uniref:tyrosine-type recombinase/integrase n=1 Tax=Kineococcus rubinsiae TaxID=2609562 RepID=UPI001431591C|nr:tyrosine-type recombinase/integrase [Kineococcus rubinsiae]NIZ93389.1 tyrosine-type recombinase/integrase [Kineococcus rubinsiae]